MAPLPPPALYPPLRVTPLRVRGGVLGRGRVDSGVAASSGLSSRFTTPL